MSESYGSSISETGVEFCATPPRGGSYTIYTRRMFSQSELSELLGVIGEGVIGYAGMIGMIARQLTSVELVVVSDS